MINRSGKLLSVFLFLFVFFFPAISISQTDIVVKGAGRLFPIAIPRLCLASGDSDAVSEIPKTVSRNLDLSGYFEVLNPDSFIETPGKCSADTEFAYSDWSVIGAEGLVKGVVYASNGSLKIQLFLHDVARQEVVLGKEYQGAWSQIPSIAHKFSNEIMRFFTGVPGVFGSKIAFSTKVGRFKELYVMDMNGMNIRQLTEDRGLALSSSWNVSGDSLIYTSYRNRVPDLFKIDVDSKRVSQLTNDRALELGGKYSSDGSQIVASRTMGRSSDIVLYSADGSSHKRIAGGDGSINVSPDWSPDDSRITFVSNRSGGPQIYVMNSDGTARRRISYVDSNYCTSPSWSPMGDKIAFVCRADRGHQLFAVNPDGSDRLQLTSYGNNEDPSWSPDGRFISFATTFGRGATFHIALIRSDGSNLRQLTRSRSGDTEPAWGPVPY